MKFNGRLLLAVIIALAMIPCAYAIYLGGGPSISTNGGQSYGFTSADNNGAVSLMSATHSNVDYVNFIFDDSGKGVSQLFRLVNGDGTYDFRFKSDNELVEVPSTRFDVDLDTIDLNDHKVSDSQSLSATGACNIKSADEIRVWAYALYGMGMGDLNDVTDAKRGAVAYVDIPDKGSLLGYTNFVKATDTSVTAFQKADSISANKAVILCSASYMPSDSEDSYVSQSYASWNDEQSATGSFSTKAKSVNAATSNLEMILDTSNVQAISVAGDSEDFSVSDEYYYSLPALKLHGTSSSGLATVATGDISKFQVHEYSHAYPYNGHQLHGVNEFVSTMSVGIEGSGVSDKVYRLSHTPTGEEGTAWEEATAGSNYIPNANVNFRATDITVTDLAGFPIRLANQDNLWAIDDRSNIQYDKVPWGIEMMYGQRPTWFSRKLTETYGGQGVDVAVIDSGVDTLHPDLVMRMADYADQIAVEYGDAQDSNGNHLADLVGHGTHVCGILAADGGFDGEGIWGMAPQVNLHVYNVHPLSEALISNAIYKATDLGCDIISMSFGTSASYGPALDYASENGVLLVAAAGNGIRGGDPTIIYPARATNVVAVGAVDKDGNAAWWSSPGYNVNDGIIKEREVMFGAPGVNVLSTAPTFESETSETWYATKSGTSMATPHISGMAAKLLSNNLEQSADDIVKDMQEKARRNDVTRVTVSSGEVSKYQKEITDASITYEGTPVGDYYSYLKNTQNKKEWSFGKFFNWFFFRPNVFKGELLQGEDCLTGLGIPRQET